MIRKSVYLRPFQLRECEGLLESRRVGIAFQNFMEMLGEGVPEMFAESGAEFIGLSAAIAIGQGDPQLAKAQLARLDDSISYHIALCRASGSSAPYRLWTEPGHQLGLKQPLPWVEEVMAVSLARASKLLPGDMAIEVSQNCLMNHQIVRGWVRALDIAAAVRPSMGGCQAWLSPIGGLTPGALMGTIKMLTKAGHGATISEFGAVVLNPQSPHPSQDTTEMGKEWRGLALTKWFLTTGLSPEEAPYWLPLDDYRHGPYEGLRWPSLALFDAEVEDCYSRGAQAGGPAGVGTDFRTVQVPARTETRD